MASRERPVAAVAAGIFLFMAGLVVAVYTLEQWRAEQDRLSIAARAHGTVTGAVNGHPLVTFAQPGGDRITFTAREVPASKYPDGSGVDVLYRIDDPSDAIVDRPAARRARPLMLGGLALLVMAFGAYVSWYARHRDDQRRAAM